MIRHILAALAMLAAVGPAAARGAKPLCTGASRTCYARTARAYFDAILAGRADDLPLAEDVRVTEQNHLIATSRAQFLKEFRSTGATKGLRNLRMLVDERRGEVAVMVLSDVKMPDQPPFTVRRIQRLKIGRGLIREVELIIFIDSKPEALWPDDPTP